MNKKLLIILLSILIITVAFYKTHGFGVLQSPTAFAVGDLTVDWGIGVGNVGAIFNIANMAPGDSQTKTVVIQNGARTARIVAMKGILTASDSARLSDKMDIEISKGATNLYGGSPNKTLTDFFDDSLSPAGINLFTLNPGQNQDLTIKVTFDKTAGNDLQKKSLTFDIQIGIGFNLPTACTGIKFDGPPIFGTAGNDTLHAGNGNKIIVSFDGNDTIFGGNGRDCIIAGNGNNKIFGGNNGDIIVSGNGNNRINGGNGNDVIIVGHGHNIIDGSNGNDSITTSVGNNQINGGNGDDNILVSGGNNIIHGGNGNDTIQGGPGNDRIYGENGNDVLVGGGGVDFVDGGNGFDKCSGTVIMHCEATP